MKCYEIWTFALFSLHLFRRLLPMHGSFAVMSGNFKSWNSWLECILLLQQRVCCWYFGEKIYAEYQFFSNEACSDTCSGLTWTLLTNAEVHLMFDFLKVGAQRGFRPSSVQWIQKELLFSPTQSILERFSRVVLLGSCRNIMFCLAQQLLMPSIPKAPPPVSSMKS